MVEEVKKPVVLVPSARSVAEQIASTASASIHAEMLKSVTSIQKSIALSPAVLGSLASVQKTVASIQKSVAFDPATLNAIKSLQQSATLSPALMSAISSWGTTGAASILRGFDLGGFNKIWESQAAPLAQVVSPLREMIAQHQAETARLVANAVSPLTQMQTEWAERLALITSDFADLYKGFDFGGIRRRLLLPTNLPTRYEVLLPEMKRLLEDEGIPLAWVPRQEIVEALLAAGSAEKRTAILLEHADEILEDCAELVADMDAESLAAVLPIAREVIEGFGAGRRKIAAIAAVTITNTVVEHNRWATNERSARKRYTLSTEVDIREFTLIATLSALIVFYREWHPQAPTPMPGSLARHVVAHNLRDEHLSERNCLIAVMLMTSLLQTVQHEAMLRLPRAA